MWFGEPLCLGFGINFAVFYKYQPRRAMIEYDTLACKLFAYQPLRRSKPDMLEGEEHYRDLDTTACYHGLVDADVDTVGDRKFADYWTTGDGEQDAL
jgi:hypothetical protein